MHLLWCRFNRPSFGRQALIAASIAGGETVATFLAATTFYLCKFPDCQRKLQKELQANFGNYHDITATTTLQLPYLQAVIKEGLRIYPPGSQGFPRISPGASVDGRWVPPGVSLFRFSAVVQKITHGCPGRSLYECLERDSRREKLPASPRIYSLPMA